MPPPRRRLPSAGFWTFACLGLLIALRYAASPPAPGTRRFDEAPLRAGPCRVTRVLAGDELAVVQDAARGEVVVRLLATEAADPERDGADLAAAARAFTNEFVARGPATVAFDQHRLDDQGRMLVYLGCGEAQLNTALIEEGLARFRSIPGNNAARERPLRDAQDAARAAQRGLWRPSRAADAAAESIPSL